MARMNDIFTPGWSTSKPGDMKNSEGLPTKFAKPRNLFPVPDETVRVGGRSKAAIDDFNSSVTADTAKTLMSGMSITQEQFMREYMVDPSGSVTSASPRAAVSRDTPQTDTDGAW